MLPNFEAAHFRQLTLDWLEAWKERDEARLERILAPEFFMVNRQVSGLTSDRQAWLRLALQHQPLLAYRVEFLRISSTLVTAIVFYRLHLMLSPQLSRDFQHYMVTDAWTFSVESWQALSRQAVYLD